MLSRIVLTSDAFLTCTAHALTTEREEVMGLLLGDTAPEDQVLKVWGVCLLTRSDRRPDRVEISAYQLTQAIETAEKLTAETGTKTRVVGWYHSHPHITVEPSHVDVRTQGEYQQLDSGFIGLIFSCFNEESSAVKTGRVQVTAFQCHDDNNPTRFSAMPTQTQVLNADGSVVQQVPGGVQAETTADAQSNGATNTTGESQPAYPSATDTAQSTSPDTNTDPATAAAPVQPKVEQTAPPAMKPPQYRRTRVRLYVLPPPSYGQSPWPALHRLQEIMTKEEQEMYQDVLNRCGGATTGSMTAIHHGAVYVQSIARLSELSIAPLANLLRARTEVNEQTIRELEAEKSRLQAELTSETAS